MAIEPDVRVQAEDFDIAAETARLAGGRHDIGAVVTFTGRCRDEGGRLAALELEHYPGMAEAEIARICRVAIDRWPVTGLTAIHRFGKVAPGGNIVLVLAASAHRQAAFDAANFVMDYLKTSAPFWKKEHFVDGSEGGWVSAKDADDAARERWQPSPLSTHATEHPEFAIETSQKAVRLWSSRSMPLSPSGSMLDARNTVRKALPELKPESGEILHCVYTSPSLGRNDVENILFYNIGTGSFGTASQNGLAFSFKQSTPEPAPSGLGFRSLSEYYLAPYSIKPKEIAAEFSFTVEGRSSVFELWWQCTNAEGRFSTQIAGTFGLRIRVGSTVQPINLGDRLKKLVDAIVSSLHADPSPNAIAVDRLAQKFGLTSSEIAHRLKNPKFPVLPAVRKPLVRPHIGDKPHSVQWFPEDNNCIECVLLPMLSEQSLCRVEVYAV